MTLIQRLKCLFGFHERKEYLEIIVPKLNSIMRLYICKHCGRRDFGCKDNLYLELRMSIYPPIDNFSRLIDNWCTRRITNDELLVGLDLVRAKYKGVDK